MAADENNKFETRLVSLKELNLWGDTNGGRFAWSIKNGYPRITYFFKKEENEEKARMINGPMSMKAFRAVASLLRIVTNSKTDIAYYMKLKNKKYQSTEIELVSTLVVARRGDKVVLGLKATPEASAVTSTFGLGEYVSITKDGSDETEVSGDISALSYADFMLHVADKYTSEIQESGGVPNSERKQLPKSDYKPVKEEYDNF